MSIVHTTKIQIPQTKTECNEKYGLNAASFWWMSSESLILVVSQKTISVPRTRHNPDTENCQGNGVVSPIQLLKVKQYSTNIHRFTNLSPKRMLAWESSGFHLIM